VCVHRVVGDHVRQSYVNDGFFLADSSGYEEIAPSHAFDHKVSLLRGFVPDCCNWGVVVGRIKFHGFGGLRKLEEHNA
jgi:hypothetical protein